MKNKEICKFMDVPFPKNYDKRKRNVGLKEKHIRFLQIFSKLGLHHFCNYYVLGFFRKING